MHTNNTHTKFQSNIFIYSRLLLTADFFESAKEIAGFAT